MNTVDFIYTKRDFDPNWGTFWPLGWCPKDDFEEISNNGVIIANCDIKHTEKLNPVAFTYTKHDFDPNWGTFWPLGPKAEFCQIWVIHQFVSLLITYYHKKNKKKTNDRILRKSQKTLKMAHFGPILTPNTPIMHFFENRAPSVFS